MICTWCKGKFQHGEKTVDDGDGGFLHRTTMECAEDLLNRLADANLQVREERERCAKVVDGFLSDDFDIDTLNLDQLFELVASKIREGAEKPKSEVGRCMKCGKELQSAYAYCNECGKMPTEKPVRACVICGHKPKDATEPLLSDRCCVCYTKLVNGMEKPKQDCTQCRVVNGLHEAGCCFEKRECEHDWIDLEDSAHVIRNKCRKCGLVEL